MSRTFVYSVVVLHLLSSSAALSAPDTIAGVWKVVSIETMAVVSGKVAKPFGDQPVGTFVFTPGGQMSALITTADRKPPAGPNPTEAERAELLRTLSAYTGSYRVDGNKLIFNIANSSIRSWNGTERTLTFEMKGKTVTATSAPFKSAMSGVDIIAVNVWERVE